MRQEQFGADVCENDFILHPKDVIDLRSHHGGRSIVPHFLEPERFLAMLVSKDQIAIGSDRKAFSALSGDSGADRTIVYELPEGFRQICSKCQAASYRKNINPD